MGSGANAESPGISPRAGRALSRNPDFLVPYVAETQSIAGDQIGRVALSLLVFDRTGSATWTALTYALTFLPPILGGIVLGGAGDRFPRVWVMVSADVVRAALFAGMAVPGLPLPIIVVLVAIAFFVGPAFTAAMVSRLAAVLVPERFRTASGIRMISSQTAQVAGFAVGGVIVAAVNPRVALLLNAATFAVSALVIGAVLGVASRHADKSQLPASHATQRSGTAPVGPGSGVAAPRLWREPLRPLIALTALAGFFVVPEGLAVPVARHLDAPSEVAGLLLAAGPLGSALGAALLVKVVPPRHGLAVARTMAVACGLPLLATAALSAWPLVFICWAMSGALWAYQVDVATTLVHLVDDGARSRLISRASALLLGVQGLGLVAFGALGGWLGAQWGVTLAGLVGVCCAGAIGIHDSAGGRARRAPAAHRAVK